MRSGVGSEGRLVDCSKRCSLTARSTVPVDPRDHPAVDSRRLRLPINPESPPKMRPSNAIVLVVHRV